MEYKNFEDYMFWNADDLKQEYKELNQSRSYEKESFEGYCLARWQKRDY